MTNELYTHSVMRGATKVATPTLIAGYDMARSSQSVLYPQSNAYGAQQYQPREAGLKRGRVEFLCAELPRLRDVRNYVTNPSFETNTTGWSGSSMTIARVTDPVPESGAYVLRATVSTDGASRGVLLGSSASARPALVAGQQYSATAFIRSSTVAQARLALTFYNAAGSTLGGAITGTSKTMNGFYVRLSETFTAPVDAVAARIGIYIVGTATAGMTFDLDSVMVNDGTPETYRDGSSIGWEWDGTPNASESRVTQPPTASATAYAIHDSFCTGAVHTISTDVWTDGTTSVIGSFVLDGEARMTLLEDRRTWLVTCDLQEV